MYICTCVHKYIYLYLSISIYLPILSVGRLIGYIAIQHIIVRNYPYCTKMGFLRLFHKILLMICETNIHNISEKNHLVLCLLPLQRNSDLPYATRLPQFAFCHCKPAHYLQSFPLELSMH